MLRFVACSYLRVRRFGWGGLTGNLLRRPHPLHRGAGTVVRSRLPSGTESQCGAEIRQKYLANTLATQQQVCIRWFSSGIPFVVPQSYTTLKVVLSSCSAGEGGYCRQL
eukprot:EG_transcript_17379